MKYNIYTASWELRHRRLEASITFKWLPIIQGQGRDEGGANCHCCTEFWCSHGPGCTNCPIFIYTNTELCQNTPYTYVADLLDFYEKHPSEMLDVHAELTAAAQGEYDFLQKVYKDMWNNPAKYSQPLDYIPEGIL